MFLVEWYDAMIGGSLLCSETMVEFYRIFVFEYQLGD
jgi:hypothetical protein